MKYLPAFLFCVTALPSFSQKKDTVSTNNNRSVVRTSLSDVHGYIDRTRLDSINSIFATFTFPTRQTITFDYGQNWVDTRLHVITDSIGKPLRFSNSSFAIILNFFHFNHWDYVANYQTSANEFGNVSFPVLKKW